MSEQIADRILRWIPKIMVAVVFGLFVFHLIAWDKAGSGVWAFLSIITLIMFSLDRIADRLDSINTIVVMGGNHDRE